ncbi:MAG TPA: nucleotide exchange factor GrpE [Candidatus Cloacimonas sp.]|jgi:molecular chaperone GrpE|nr:nucleotide exchange factor GrpE [Candidatus Cloacimonas sp.]MDD2250744.1 nucleotide exchange factor GrpE [Candidatus Cloacimonadota bacterium]MCK9158403.1 nucleotide exchange factor GrpE [Candidatus Cloacimonas sp.]MCK9165245.1 nucleotide exchange factor GrpE [Candidatus Cloacimonas sp.]MDD3734745.1 nucleotide exchange factor GrpE [Candidatus Cloacimonadota bacterium]
MNKKTQKEPENNKDIQVEEVIEEQKTDKIQELEQEIAEWKDKYLRCMAEFENFRKRSIAEKADWIRLATQKFALEICDVLDNFERAILQGSEEEKSTPFGKGVLMIEQQLRKALEREGVRKIEALGQPFNPEFHDALAHIPSDLENNTVAAIIQNGYTMHDKVLRPVRVAVSNGSKINNESQEE